MVGVSGTGRLVSSWAWPSVVPGADAEVVRKKKRASVWEATRTDARFFLRTTTGSNLSDSVKSRCVRGVTAHRAATVRGAYRLRSSDHLTSQHVSLELARHRGASRSAGMRAALACAAAFACLAPPAVASSRSRVPATPSGSPQPSQSMPALWCSRAYIMINWNRALDNVTVVPTVSMRGSADDEHEGNICQRACCARSDCASWKYRYHGCELLVAPLELWGAISSGQAFYVGVPFYTGRHLTAAGKAACCARVPSGSVSASRAPSLSASRTPSRSAAATASRSRSRSGTRSRSRKPK